MDEVKSWFISPAADEDVPLTADASVADAWGPCECGSGMVFLKAPTLSDVRQEFGKRWSGSDPDYFKKSSYDARCEAEPVNFVIVNLPIQGKSSQTVVIERGENEARYVRPPYLTPRPRFRSSLNSRVYRSTTAAVSPCSR
ncbi:hypothetical protein [Streptomyces sp. NPDC001635]